MAKHSTRIAAEPPAVEATPNGQPYGQPQGAAPTMVGLAEWRKRKIVEGSLPSGLQVTLRRVNMLDLISEGHVPATLDVLVRKASSEGFGVTDTLEFLPLVDTVVKACLIDPPIADEADETHVTIGEIPIEDRLAIFAWANSEAQQLRPFRAGSGRDVEPPRAGDGVSPAA